MLGSSRGFVVRKAKARVVARSFLGRVFRREGFRGLGDWGGLRVRVVVMCWWWRCGMVVREGGVVGKGRRGVMKVEDDGLMENACCRMFLFSGC